MSRKYLAVFFTVLFLAPGAAVAAPATCADDYLKNERWVPHSLTPEDLKTALAIANREGVDRGWKFISRFGDNYAGLASLVTRPSDGGFSKMIHRHWQTVVGLELERTYFSQVALRHFHQYVRILETGTWPDSNQILMSYLTAVRSFGLPDELVFDAAWMNSRYHVILDWRVFNVLPLERWADTWHVCMHVNPVKADKIIEADFQL